MKSDHALQLPKNSDAQLCLKCGQDTLDTGWECSECGYDNMPWYYRQGVKKPEGRSNA